MTYMTFFGGGKPAVSTVGVLLFLLLTISFAGRADAGTQDGSLSMEVITAYNLVVDSNIETPAGYGPSAAHLGVKICNNGSTTISNIYINIGDLLDTNTFVGTPGIYPERTVSVSGSKAYAGTFSLTHEGGEDDATRLVFELSPGECLVQYWLVSYPVMDDDGNAVTGSANVTEDDLWLNYDIWVEAEDAGTTRQVYETRKVTMRNEISAMANKIWPNTTSKVPAEYLDAFEAELGWRPQTNSATVGSEATLEGIWFDFGTIRHGFDNNGDLLPDYNAWAQPVGDPAFYDPTCFRLVKTYGVVIVKINDGTEQIIPFEDELYFENISSDNRGAIGLVFFEFVPLRAGCSITLSPYQEVASGFDNEKFNADYGTTSGALESDHVEIDFDKNGPFSVSRGDVFTYTMTATNQAAGDLGFTSFGLPLVFKDYVPTGLVYVAGSATASNSFPNGVGARVFLFN